MLLRFAYREGAGFQPGEEPTDNPRNNTAGSRSDGERTARHAISGENHTWMHTASRIQAGAGGRGQRWWWSTKIVLSFCCLSFLFFWLLVVRYKRRQFGRPAFCGPPGRPSRPITSAVAATQTVSCTCAAIFPCRPDSAADGDFNVRQDRRQSSIPVNDICNFFNRTQPTSACTLRRSWWFYHPQLFLHIRR